MKKTALFARLLAGIMTVFFLMGGGASCSDGSDKDETKTYTVTFDSKGGGEVKPQTVEEGKMAKEPEKPTRAGFKFGGWFKGDSLFVFTTPIAENITLTATWIDESAPTFNVTFRDGDVETTQPVVSGELASKPRDTSKEGYKFLGWYNGETSFDFSTPITEDITLTAKWEAVTGSGGNEDDKTPGVDPSTPGGSGTVPDSQVTKPTEVQVSGSLDAMGGGWLESAWIEWKPVSSDVNATYNVSVKKTGGDWAKIDKELIRGYGDTAGSSTVTKFRADALGLAAGSYDMKVELASDPTQSAKVSGITVNAYDRHGYAHFNGKNPGAYKLDGTLKDGAVVIYLTEGNKSTVKATFDKEYTGIKEITQAIKDGKGSKGKPVCIRVIGTVSAGGVKGSDLSSTDMKSAYALGVKDTSNVTIEGVGEDATLYYAGLAAFQCKDIEFRNLGLMLWGDDGVSIKETVGAWIHHLDIFYGTPGSAADQKKGDGSMDLKDDSQFVTMDNIHFWDSGKMSLCGMKSETGPNWITYHHNWFDHSDSRHPRIRTMTVHVYNNYYDGNSKYGVGAAMQSNAFVEYNYFRNCKYPMLSSKQGSDIATDAKGTFSGEDGGIIKSWKNYMTGQKGYVTYQQNNTEFDAYEATSRDEKVPDTVKAKQGGRTYDNFDTDAGKFYYNAYTPDAAEDIPDIVTGKKASDGRYGAGRMNGGDFKFTFNNSVDDTSDVINTALESQVKSYKSKLVSTNVTANSTSGGGNTGGGTTGGNEGDNGDSGNTGNTGEDLGHTATPTAMNTEYFTYTKAAYDTSNACIKMEAGSGVVSFTTNASATLSIVFCAPGNSDSTEVTVKQGSTVVSNTNGAETSSVTGKTQTTFTFNLPNAGTYTINATGGKAVRLFKITVTE